MSPGGARAGVVKVTPGSDRGADVVLLEHLSGDLVLVPAQADIQVQLIGQLPGGVAIDRRALGQVAARNQLVDVEIQRRQAEQRQRADVGVVVAAGVAVHVEETADGVDRCRR